MGKDRAFLALADPKDLLAVLSRDSGMVKCLEAACGRLFPEIIKAEIVKQSGPGGHSCIAPQLSGYMPGYIGYIDAVHQSGCTLVMGKRSQLHKFPVFQDILYFLYVPGFDLSVKCKLHRLSLAFCKE